LFSNSPTPFGSSGGGNSEVVNVIKSLFAKIMGKYVDGKLGVSKTKLTAIVYVIVQAIPIISQAWGHPIEIPPLVFRFLEAAGLWSLRDGIKS
jgi:hypothetical protein